MNLDYWLARLAPGDTDGAEHAQALADYDALCREVDTDPREQQRIRDVAALIDADAALYTDALRAVENNELGTARVLLRRAADLGIGDAAEILLEIGESPAEEKPTNPVDPPSPDAAITEPATSDPVVLDSGLLMVPSTTGITADQGAETFLWEVKQTIQPPTPGVEYLPDFSANLVADRLVTASLTDLKRALRHHLRALRRTEHLEVLRLNEPDVCQNSLGHWHLAAHRLLYWQHRDRLARDIDPGSVSCFSNDVWTFFEDTINRDSGDFSAVFRHNLAALWTLVLARPVSAPLLLGGRGIVHRDAPAAVARDVMTPASEIPAIPKTLTVDAALGTVLRDDGSGTPVVDGESIVGMITLADIGKVLHAAQGGAVTDAVGAHMREPVFVPVDTPVDVVRKVIDQSGTGLAAVLATDGQVAGYVTTAGLAGFGDGASSEPPPRSSRLLTC